MTGIGGQNTPEPESEQTDLLAKELLGQHQQKIYVRTDRMFVYLMLLQFVGGIILALVISPRTWFGATSALHIHLWAAFVVGGAITFLPIILVMMSPGRALNRYVIGICQMLMSGLLIHLSGGRIETHFHIFGSLAFLAFYRDWRVLVPATIVVALDHMARGIFWPQSIYGVLTATAWRSFEHAAWVLFEDVFLIISIKQSVTEMGHSARHRAALETTNTLVEAKVRERTCELQRVNHNLEAEVVVRQQAEIEAKHRQARLRSIVESASEGIVTIDARGIVETFNEAAAEMFGYQAEGVVGHNVSMLMATPHREQHDEYLRSGLNRVIGIKREVEGRRKDGTLFPMELAVSEVNIEDTRIFTAIIRDLTQQRQLQCELAQAQKLEAVGQLAAGIAHEINTPIQYVSDNTRFLKEAFGDMSTALDKFEKLLQASKDGTVDEQLVTEVEATLEQADIAYLTEEIPQAIDQSLDGVERVTKIVRAMKEFSHPGGKEKSLVDLRHTIETTITVARNEWKYVAEIVTEFDAELPEVSCLPGELNQVILNLVVNAAHAIGDTLGGDGTQKGTITVGTRRDGTWAEIFVSDTGPGIPEDVRARIFDPFFTTKGVGKGTGQGLAIARSVVVDKHGGTIDCETTPDSGTTFIVRLPITPSRQFSEAEHASLNR